MWRTSQLITFSRNNMDRKKDRELVCLLSENNEKTGHDPFNQNFWPVWPGKVVYLKRWTKRWTEIFWKFCWIDRAQCACCSQKSSYFQRWLEYIPTHLKCLKQEENLTLFFQGGFKKMLDYIINQSCDWKRVVYVQFILHKTPWTRQDHASCLPQGNIH